MKQIDSFDTTYRRMKRNNRKKESLINLRKTLDSILFSCGVIVAISLGCETAKKVNEKIEIENNYETITNEAKKIITKNVTLDGSVLHFDSYGLAHEIELLTKRKGSFYSKAVLIKVLDYIAYEENIDKNILHYLNIPAESLEEYITLEGYDSYYDMTASYKKEYYEQKRTRTRSNK